MDLSEELDDIDGELKEIETKIESLLERQQFLQSRKKLFQAQICSRIDDSLPSSSETKESDLNWSAKTFAWSEKVEKAREDIFKIRKFRPL